MSDIFRRMPLPRPPAPARLPTTAPVDERRGTVDRVQAMTGKVHRVQGVVTVDGAGEVALDVNFPVWFIERPHPSFGGVMRESEALEAGNFPTVSVVVHRWITRDYEGNVRYYTGATLAVVTTGRTGHQMDVHWEMEGKALRNPTGGGESTDSPI